MPKTPTFAGSGRDDWYTALLQYFLERLIPRLKPLTCFWWKDTCHHTKA